MKISFQENESLKYEEVPEIPFIIKTSHRKEYYIITRRPNIPKEFIAVGISGMCYCNNPYTDTEVLQSLNTSSWILCRDSELIIK